MVELTLDLVTDRVLLGFILTVLIFMRKVATEEPICVSFQEETDYYEFFTCDDSEFCCGRIPHQKCCPKLSIGAIFGIVLSIVVLVAIVVCSVAACCLWCDCCPFRRSKLRRWSGTSESGPEDTGGRHFERPGGGHPLTLRINQSREPANVERSAPTETDLLNGASETRVSADLFPQSVPQTPTTPMSISSPTEFSKLIAHDWNRQKRGDQAVSEQC